VGRPYDQKPASRGNGRMAAFAAPTRAAVDAAHAAAMAAGAQDEGPPGLRDFGRNYYRAYVRAGREQAALRPPRGGVGGAPARRTGRGGRPFYPAYALAERAVAFR
jgi:hypothetical protein